MADQAPVTPGSGWATIAPSSHRAVIAVAAITALWDDGAIVAEPLAGVTGA